MTITEQNKRAIAKASKIKCHVKMLPGRAYLVTTPQRHAYVVRMFNEDGLRFAKCNCAAGSLGNPCFHLYYAALVDDVRIEGRADRKSVNEFRKAA